MAIQSKPVLARQPLKTLWLIFAITLTGLRLPILFIYFAPKALRQHYTWTYRQAICNEILKIYFYHIGITEFAEQLTLNPGHEEKRFTTVTPIGRELRRGVLQDTHVSPSIIGGTWFPRPFSLTDDIRKTVILHFHGGAFVIGDGRQASMGAGAGLLIEYTSAKFFAPQYRLSSDPISPFPAALQDAVATYKYLLDQNIKSSQIILSGDSSGGNVAIALLRYLSDFSGLLPDPAGVLLWSPWVDLEAALYENGMEERCNAKTDFIPSALLRWGAKMYPSVEAQIDHPYISPVHHPFPSRIPLFIHVGGLEILGKDIMTFAEGMRAITSSSVLLYEEPFAPHDILMSGDLLGFSAEARIAAREASGFLKTHCGLA